MENFSCADDDTACFPLMEKGSCDERDDDSFCFPFMRVKSCDDDDGSGSGGG